MAQLQMVRWVANGLHSVRNDTKDTLCVCIHCIQMLHDLFVYFVGPRNH